MATILIVDDDATLLTAMAEALESDGHTVERASDVIHAQRRYSESRPDLVVLEVRAGNDQGWELLSEMSLGTPVVVVSASALEEDIVRGFELGAADYLAKPYRTGELQARVRARLAAAPVAAPEPVAAQAPLFSQPPPPVAPASRRPPPEEEAVFMSEAEEMALLRMSQPALPGSATRRAAPPDDEARSLGGRLRHERMLRQLTLVQIENETRVRLSYLQAMEDDKYTLLPRGPAAIQMVRVYADYLGLDGQSLADEFKRSHYIEPAVPHPALGGPRPLRPIPRAAIIAGAVVLALALSIGAIAALDPGIFDLIGAQLQALISWIAGMLGGQPA